MMTISLPNAAPISPRTVGRLGRIEGVPTGPTESLLPFRGGSSPVWGSGVGALADLLGVPEIEIARRLSDGSGLADLISDNDS